MKDSTIEIGTSATGEEQLRRYWATESEPWATVLIVHGAAEHSGRFQHVAQQLVEAGLEVHSFDWMGHGRSGGRRWDIDTYERYYTDLAERLTSVRRKTVPLVLYGHSMGGLISLGYSLSDQPSPDLLVLTAPWLGTAANPVLKVLTPLVGKLAPLLRIDGGLKGEQLSRDPAVGEAYFGDPLVESKITARWGAASLREQARVRAAMGGLRIPVFVTHGENDTIAPPHLSAPIADLPHGERRLYPRLRHEPHNEPEGNEVVADIIDWIRSKVQGSP